VTSEGGDVKFGLYEGTWGTRGPFSPFSTCSIRHFGFQGTEGDFFLLPQCRLCLSVLLTVIKLDFRNFSKDIQ